MPHSLIWLPNVLKNAGLKIATVDGWEDRGNGDVGQIAGVICHHTVGPRNGIMPSLNTLIRGTSKLSGPLSQLGLGRDGTFFIVAAGKCNHAGVGIFKGFTHGNSNFIGIEAENTGGSNDFPWPAIQMDAYQRGVAAILKHIGRGAEFCAGHKEYALPKGRKPDPSFDMIEFRSSVSRILSGEAPPPVLIPEREPAPGPGNIQRPTIRRGNIGEFVKMLQKKIGLTETGNFDAVTEATLRAFQRTHGLVPDGIAGPKTWKVFDSIA